MDYNNEPTIEMPQLSTSSPSTSPLAAAPLSRIPATASATLSAIPSYSSSRMSAAGSFPSYFKHNSSRFPWRGRDEVTHVIFFNHLLGSEGYLVWGHKLDMQDLALVLDNGFSPRTSIDCRGDDKGDIIPAMYRSLRVILVNTELRGEEKYEWLRRHLDGQSYHSPRATVQHMITFVREQLDRVGQIYRSDIRYWYPSFHFGVLTYDCDMHYAEADVYGDGERDFTMWLALIIWMDQSGVRQYRWSSFESRPAPRLQSFESLLSTLAARPLPSPVHLEYLTTTDEAPHAGVDGSTIAATTFCHTLPACTRPCTCDEGRCNTSAEQRSIGHSRQ